MSQENVEIVRQMLGAFNRGDFQASSAFLDENVELHGTSGGLSDGNIASGIEAVRQTFEMWDEDGRRPSCAPKSSSTLATRWSSFNTNSGAGGVAAWRWSPRPRSSSTCVTDV